MRYFFSILVTFLFACGPYMKAAKSVDEKNKRPTLLASASIDAYADRNTSSSNEQQAVGLAVTAVSMSNNLELEPFGERMVLTVNEYLKRHGFQVVQNKSRAENLATVNDDLKKAATVLAGTWISTNTSAYILTNNTLLLRFQRDEIANKLNGPAENEAFLFIHAEIRNHSQWLFFTRPECTLHIRVLDESGNDIMRSVSYGYGESAFFLPDRSAENLEKSLIEALRQLDTLERQAL